MTTTPILPNRRLLPRLAANYRIERLDHNWVATRDGLVLQSAPVDLRQRDPATFCSAAVLASALGAGYGEVANRLAPDFADTFRQSGLWLGNREQAQEWALKRLERLEGEAA